MSTPNAHARPEPHWRRGHTLIEVVLSTAILSIVMGAMVSTMVIASRAIDDNPVTLVAVAGDGIGDVTTDISLAQSITESTDTAVTLVVPDRDGDGQSETIRYSWSGQVGDPLMRQYNGTSPAMVADNVHSFNLSYLTTVLSAGETYPPGESGEIELASHDDAPGGKFEDEKIKEDEACAEYFKPVLPDGAMSWKVNSVALRLSRAGKGKGKDKDKQDDGVVVVQIRSADSSHKPTATVLAQATVYESTLTDAYAWTTISLGPVSNLDPDLGYCIVVQYVSGTKEAIAIEREKDGSPMPADCDYMDYDTRRRVWKDPDDKKDLRFRVRGTVTTGGS